LVDGESVFAVVESACGKIAVSPLSRRERIVLPGAEDGAGFFSFSFGGEFRERFFLPDTPLGRADSEQFQPFQVSEETFFASVKMSLSFPDAREFASLPFFLSPPLREMTLNPVTIDFLGTCGARELFFLERQRGDFFPFRRAREFAARNAFEFVLVSR